MKQFKIVKLTGTTGAVKYQVQHRVQFLGINLWWSNTWPGRWGGLDAEDLEDVRNKLTQFAEQMENYELGIESPSVVKETVKGLESEPVAPIDMVLFCPACGKQHIDAPDPHPELRNIHEVPWTNPPHRSHLCHGCGHIWRPADVPTNGVQAVKTVGKADSPIVEPAELAACKRDAERLRLELLSCSTDCIYLQEITENKQNLHGWLEFRRKAIDAAMAAGEKAS